MANPRQLTNLQCVMSYRSLAGIPGSPAAFYHFLMDAAGDCKLCDHQKVSKNLVCRRQVFRLTVVIPIQT